MTEAEWLACADPKALEGIVSSGRLNERTGRLVTSAYCRLVWHLLPHKASRRSVEMAEAFVDGAATEDELRDTHSAAWRVWEATIPDDIRERSLATLAVHVAASASSAPTPHEPMGWLPEFDRSLRMHSIIETARIGAMNGPDTRPAVCRILRCIFGNPFRPSPPLPPAVLAWNDGTVVRIAQGIYEERRLPEGTLDTGRLAVLADCLLDAGCEDEELIRHCRSAGPHVRGCWAIDLILGKE